MCNRSFAPAISGLIALAVQIPAAVALAETAAGVDSTETKNETAEPPADAPVVPAAAKPAGKATVAAKPAAAVACNCSPSHAPLYVEDWGRLAALTRSDPLVFEQAEFWRNRHDTSRWLLGAGVFLGGGAALLGMLDRLSNDTWSTTSKWSVPGGLGVVVTSLFLNWAFSPDRDDLLTVINHWNIRHPDLQLAP